MNYPIIVIVIILILVLLWFSLNNGLFKENFREIDPAQRFRLDRTFEYTRDYEPSRNPQNETKKFHFAYNNQAYNISPNTETFEGQKPPTGLNDIKAVDAGMASLISREQNINMVKNPDKSPEREAVMKNRAVPKDPIGPPDIGDPDLTYYTFEGPPFNPPYQFNKPSPGKLFAESYYTPQGIDNLGQIARSYYKSRIFPEYPNVKYMYENSWDSSKSFMNNNRYGVPAKSSYGRTSITGIDKF